MGEKTEYKKSRETVPLSSNSSMDLSKMYDFQIIYVPYWYSTISSDYTNVTIITNEEVVANMITKQKFNLIFTLFVLLKWGSCFKYDH